MPYSLRRVSDGAGDTGQMSKALRLVDGRVEYGEDRPLIGYNIQVGSHHSRTYEGQDYWITTVVQEIIEERENYVKFRTNNSVYEWEKF